MSAKVASVSAGLFLSVLGIALVWTARGSHVAQFAGCLLCAAAIPVSGHVSRMLHE